MSPAVTNILTLSTIGISIAGIISLLSDVLLGHQSRVDKRLDEEFRKKLTEKARSSTQLFRDIGRLASDNRFGKRGVSEQLDIAFEQAGMDSSRVTFYVATFLAFLFVGAVSLYVTHHPVLTLAGAIIGLPVPFLAILLKGQRRRRIMCRQLPEACEMMSGAISAGQTLSGAFQLVSRESPAPLAEELAYCHEQQSMGMSPDSALRDLARRTGIVELKMLVVVLLIQRQTGGNASHLLDNLAVILRKRIGFASKARALSGESRMQAAVLLVMPFALFAAMYFLNRGYADLLLLHPEIIGATLVSEAVGAVWIQRIVSVEY